MLCAGAIFLSPPEKPMKERKFNLAIASFPYGGNGGISNEYPGVRDFLIEVSRKAKADPRIDEIHHQDFSDTPITMTRNKSVLWARQVGADFLLMVDSDMQPDSELREDPEAKPFWDTSLDFCVENYDQGPNVVCAPYCGPPPIENVYVFYWGLNSHDCPNDKGRIEQYSREEASRMRGIQPCAAQPTGLILFDMRAFDFTDPAPYFKELRKTLTQEDAMARIHPWFYYEYEDIYQSQKCSTEDVTATRDISFHGWAQTGRETIYCNWDAWAGHVKPKIVRKPRPLDSKSMHAQYRDVVRRGFTQEEKRIFVGAGKAGERAAKQVARFEEQPIPHVLSEDITEDGIIRIGMHTPKCDLDALTELVKECQPGMAVEVGSWVGESALAICKGLPERSQLVCVDTFLGSPCDGSGRMAIRVGGDVVRRAFDLNTKKYQDENILRVWSMTDALARAQMEKRDWKVDFLYLDADHEYDFVRRQIEGWTKFMSPEGVIAGHDFAVGFPGVERAVREMFSEFTHIEGTAVWYADVRNRKSANTNGKHCEVGP
jgi:hypothetical protein